MRALGLILGPLAVGICASAMIESTPSAALTLGGRVEEMRQHGFSVLQIAAQLKKGQCVKGRKYSMTKDGVFYRCYEQTCGMGPGLPRSDKPSCTAASGPGGGKEGTTVPK
jgi:hypothetical protein